MNFTSLCILSYERQDMTRQSIDSLIKNTKSPYELIIHDDSSHETEYLYSLYLEHKISKLVLNCGENRGIKHSVHTCFNMAEGEYIYKLDTDLIYEPDWLATTNRILENNKDVIMVGLFDYSKYDPSDKRFKILDTRADCYIVNDFVSSGFGFNRVVYNQFGHLLHADGWHLSLRDRGFKLAIPRKDVVRNIGFGIGKSTYVVEKDGKVVAREYHDKPHIIGI